MLLQPCTDLLKVACFYLLLQHTIFSDLDLILVLCHLASFELQLGFNELFPKLSTASWDRSHDVQLSWRLVVNYASCF